MVPGGERMRFAGRVTGARGGGDIIDDFCCDIDGDDPAAG